VFVKKILISCLSLSLAACGGDATRPASSASPAPPAGDATSSAVMGGSSAAISDVADAPLALSEEPYGYKTLVDEIDTALTPPSRQDSVSAADPARSLTTIYGKAARVLVPGDRAKFLTYRLGRGKNLLPRGAYILEIEYPDDVPRTMFVANRGADMVRGFSTGTATGDARKAYVFSTLESLNYPQSSTWRRYQSLFFLHERTTEKSERNAACAMRNLVPKDGFDVSVFQTRERNDPMSRGVAIGKIRLYRVNDTSKLAAPITYPEGSPKRHIFWREEMADEAVSSDDVLKRAMDRPIDWYAAKMELGRAMAFDTVGKDLLEFGYNQGMESTDTNWMYNAGAPLANSWKEIVETASGKGLFLMPYLEYGGSAGGNCDGGACNRSAGYYKSMGKQRRTRKLFYGTELPGTNKQDYTRHYITERISADLTDPDTHVDMEKVLALVLAPNTDRSQFAGIWLRARTSKMPISFAPEAVARYNAANADKPRTIETLRNDENARLAYYRWWFNERKRFLGGIRTYLDKQNLSSESDLLFTASVLEPVPPARKMNAPHPVCLVTDQKALWGPYAKTLTDGDTWYQHNWCSVDPAEALAGNIHQHGLELFELPERNRFGLEEWFHSAPHPDPANYTGTQGIAMTYEFGNGLYTVADANALASYSNASEGQSAIKHYPLNEDNGAHGDAANCSVRSVLHDNDVFDNLLGYVSVAVDRAGPYSTLAEARLLANGNPYNLGYLEPSSMSRGFPAYVRRFNQALLSLPAVKAVTVNAMASSADVVVRQYASGGFVYYAVINPTMHANPGVTVNFGAPADGVVDLLAKKTYLKSQLRFSLYPGEVRTFKVRSTF
jgi:hypothetical protein